MTYNEYGPYAMNQHVSTASQLGYRNPHIEIDKNTFKTSEIVLQMLIESRHSEKKADRQFIISLLISVATLLFSAAAYFQAIK